MTPTPPEPPPAVVVAAGALPAAAAACRQLPFYRFEAASSSPPPWFPASPSPTATTGAPAPVTKQSQALTPTAMDAAQQGPPPGAGGDASAAAAVPVAEVVVEVEDKMDLLWEDFNEELVARGGGKGGSYRARATGVGLQQPRELWPESESSDAESSSETAAARGCAPVLRPSTRSVGAVRRRAGTWVLLMRIFRRLFVIEKTAISAARRQHAAGATTMAS